MLTRCLVSTKFYLFCSKSPLYSGLHTIYKIEDKNSSISAALGINQHAEVQTQLHKKAAHTDDDPQVSMEHFRGGIPQENRKRKMKVRRELFYPDEKAGPSTFGETTSNEESVSSKVAEEAVPVEEVEPAVEAALPIMEAAPAIEEVDPVEAIPVVEEAAPVVAMEAPTLKKPPPEKEALCRLQPRNRCSQVSETCSRALQACER